MSGCHNPNVCHHVDGEFCERCYYKVPAMSGFQVGQDIRIKKCIACFENLPCKCVWQFVRDCQDKIEGISERLSRLETQKEFNLPTIGQLNKIALDKIKKGEQILVIAQENPDMNGIYERSKENPSRQHLEKCLHEKNMKIAELEEEVRKCKNDLNCALINDRLARSDNTKLKRQVESLLEQLKSAQTANTNNWRTVACPTTPPTQCCKDFPHVGKCHDS